MANYQLLECLQTERAELERVRYFSRQLLTRDDMATDQDFVREKLRRHNRFLHGWGVVCGLVVVADPAEEMPWRVRIEPGYALGTYGDEIFVGEPVFLDLARCGPGAMTDPCEPSLIRFSVSGEGHEIYIAIKYAECLARPVRAMAAGCACEEEACEYSRVRDSFQIECLPELPPYHARHSPGPSLCDFVSGRALAECPSCPDGPWVVLARVMLPNNLSFSIANRAIDNMVRRPVFSTAVLQEQLIRCCCEEQPQLDTLRIISVEFLHNDVKVGELPENFSSDYPSFDPNQPISMIRVTFNRPVDPQTVTTYDGQPPNASEPPVSFLVQQSSETANGLQAITGEIEVHENQVTFWRIRSERRIIFFTGTYHVTLFGYEDTANEQRPAIATQDGARLDGEPLRLPSGNGNQGGNFRFQFVIQQPPID